MKPLFWCAATVGDGPALDASSRDASAGQRVSIAPWLCAVAMACVVPHVCAFNFDDLEKVEKVEQKERSVRQAREAAARREEEARRQAELAAAQNRGGRGGGAGRGDGANWISVEAECVAVICNVTKLTINGGPGRFEPSFRAARMWAIHKGFNGALAGQFFSQRLAGQHPDQPL